MGLLFGKGEGFNFVSTTFHRNVTCRIKMKCENVLRGTVNIFCCMDCRFPEYQSFYMRTINHLISFIIMFSTEINIFTILHDIKYDTRQWTHTLVFLCITETWAFSKICINLPFFKNSKELKVLKLKLIKHIHVHAATIFAMLKTFS